MIDDPTEADDVAAAYDLWAATYDLDRNITRDLDARVVRQAQLAIADRDVLELGCGTGKNTIWLAKDAKSVTALDFSFAMIARAREHVRSAHVRFVEHDVRIAWPVSDSSVDVVVSNLVLEHVENLVPIYAEVARVLKRPGQFFLCELHPERQHHGGRAEFVHPATGIAVSVPAYVHTVAEIVNSGLAVGLTVRHIGEHTEPGVPVDASPRLLSVLFEK
jgi:ubiquinone/menaquinone biosynthesis C-methylase UbiE